MKTLIATLLIAATAQAQQTVEVFNAYGRQDDKDWENKARQIFISGVILGQGYARWLIIGRVNTNTLPADQKDLSPITLT